MPRTGSMTTHKSPAIAINDGLQAIIPMSRLLMISTS